MPNGGVRSSCGRFAHVQGDFADPLRFANTVLELVWNRDHVACLQVTLAERFAVEDRGRFYDAVGALRDVVVNHLLQLLAAATMEAPRTNESLDAARYRLFEAVVDADPARYVRGQYSGYRATAGVAPRSTTETYAALEPRTDNERWQDVPVYIRASKHLPITQTELRLVFCASSPLMFLGRLAAPSLRARRQDRPRHRSSFGPRRPSR